VATLLAPVVTALALASVFAAPSAHAANSNAAVLVGPQLTITELGSGDTSTVSTLDSTSLIQVTPADAMTSAWFANVGNISFNFTAATQTVTFNSTNNSFLPQVTIGTLTGAATDSVVIAGSTPGNSVTLTGVSNYGGGTAVQGGVLIFNNAAALGTGAITLSNGTELRGAGTLTLTNLVNFAALGTNNATISSASGGKTGGTGGMLTLNDLDASNTAGLTFGSTGNTGTVILGPTVIAGTKLNSLHVAFGTLLNGTGNLGLLTNQASTTTVDAGATLAINDFNTTIKSLSGAGSVVIGKNMATVLTLNGTSTFGGVISGTGQLNAAGNTTLTGANTYTGGTTVASASTLRIGNGGTTGSIMGNVTVNSTGLLEFDLGSVPPPAPLPPYYTFKGIISGGGQVEEAGTGVFTLSGNNTYSGGTIVAGTGGGALVAGNNNAFGTGAVTIRNGGALGGMGTIILNNLVEFNSGKTNPAITNATIFATKGGNFTLNDLDTTNTSALTFGLTGNTGTVILGGTVNNPNSTGTVTVAFGTLKDGGGNLTNLTSTANTTVAAGATLAINDFNTTVKSLNGAGAVMLGSKMTTMLTLDGGNFAGVISGAGQVNLAGSNPTTTTFTGTNTYTGGTTIQGGNTLRLGNGGTTGSIVGNVTVNSTGLLEFDLASVPPPAPVPQFYTFKGIISGAGGVEQNGTGTITLSGNNTYTGGTLINKGVLSITTAQAVGTGAVTLNTGAELNAKGTMTLNNAVNFSNHSPNFTEATISSNGGMLTLTNLDTTNAHGTLSPINPFGLTFGSPGNTGTVILAGTITNPNTTNAVTVAFGTLQNGGSLGTLTTPVGVETTVNLGATLNLNDINITVSNLLGAGNVVIGKKPTTTLTLGLATFGGVISGSGQLDATSGVTLAGTNTYSGGTTVGNAAFLQLGDYTSTGSIMGNVTLTTTSSDLLFALTTASTFKGVISGAGEVEQLWTGPVTLSANNTYSGGTFISTGTLIAGNSNALGTGPVTLNTGAELSAIGTTTLNNTVNFLGGVTNATISGAKGGTLTLNNLDVTDTTNLTFGSAANTGTVVLAGTITDPNATNVTLAFGTLQNGGSLGTLTSAATAQTTLNAGTTLNLNDFSTTVANLTGAGNVNLGKKTTTVLTLQNGTVGGAISGAGRVSVAAGLGTVTFQKASTYTGGTNVNSGTLLVTNGTNGSATGTGPVSIQNAAALGGGGTVMGPITLNSGGTIAPGIANSSSFGTQLNGSSLLWNGGGTMDFQLGPSIGDEVILKGALTEGTAGSFTIDIVSNGLTAGTDYTLMTFASTTFLHATDFNLVVSGTVNGTLVLNKTSLMFDATHASLPAQTESIAAPIDSTGSTTPTTDPGFSAPSEITTLTPTPEPGSALLLAFGGAAILGWRRRRAVG
jgi:autotransporter-associated beta strand protein